MTGTSPGTVPATPPSGTLPLPDPLPGLQEEFSCFRIWREHTCDRVRYVARSLHPGLNPHTVVTDDIGELRAALQPSRQAACPGGHGGQQESWPPARRLPAPAS
jgi:hypothetical protein